MFLIIKFLQHVHSLVETSVHKRHFILNFLPLCRSLDGQAFGQFVLSLERVLDFLEFENFLIKE